MYVPKKNPIDIVDNQRSIIAIKPRTKLKMFTVRTSINSNKKRTRLGIDIINDPKASPTEYSNCVTGEATNISWNFIQCFRFHTSWLITNPMNATLDTMPPINAYGNKLDPVNIYINMIGNAAIIVKSINVNGSLNVGTALNHANIKILRNVFIILIKSSY